MSITIYVSWEACSWFSYLWFFGLARGSALNSAFGIWQVFGLTSGWEGILVHDLCMMKLWFWARLPLLSHQVFLFRVNQFIVFGSFS